MYGITAQGNGYVSTDSTAARTPIILVGFPCNFDFPCKFRKSRLYTLFQNGHYFSGPLSAFKLALVASFLNSKYKRIFSLERGNKG